MKTRQVITGLLPAFCLLGCSTAIPANPSSGLAQPSSISNTDLQSSGEKPGAGPKGAILDGSGKPIEDCNIEIKGDTRELAIVTNTPGTLSVGTQRGSQQIITSCDKHQIYQKEEFPVQVPETDEFKQAFTVRRK